MKNEHITHLLADYLDNQLEPEQRKKVAVHLRECKSCRDEFGEFEVLLKTFKSEKEQMIVSPSTLKAGFDEMLEREKKNAGQPEIKEKKKIRSLSWYSQMLKIAAGIALLMGSFMLGSYYQKNQSNLAIGKLEEKNGQLQQLAMLSLMENESASKRIQGVNYSEEFSKPDETVITAIINRMLNDENTNVRLAATQALAKFTDSKKVKNAFVEALEAEKDPTIQILVIQTLVKMQEKKALKPMQRLLDYEETEPFVKEHILSLMPNIA